MTKLQYIKMINEAIGATEIYSMLCTNDTLRKECQSLQAEILSENDKVSMTDSNLALKTALIIMVTTGSIKPKFV